MHVVSHGDMAYIPNTRRMPILCGAVLTYVDAHSGNGMPFDLPSQIGAVANAAGVGGGAIYIPIFNALVGFGESKHAPHTPTEGAPHCTALPCRISFLPPGRAPNMPSRQRPLGLAAHVAWMCLTLHHRALRDGTRLVASTEPATCHVSHTMPHGGQQVHMQHQRTSGDMPPAFPYPLPPPCNFQRLPLLPGPRPIRAPYSPPGPAPYRTPPHRTTPLPILHCLAFLLSAELKPCTTKLPACTYQRNHSPQPPSPACRFTVAFTRPPPPASIPASLASSSVVPHPRRPQASQPMVWRNHARGTQYYSIDTHPALQPGPAELNTSTAQACIIRGAGAESS